MWRCHNMHPVYKKRFHHADICRKKDIVNSIPEMSYTISGRMAIHTMRVVFYFHSKMTIVSEK